MTSLHTWWQAFDDIREHSQDSLPDKLKQCINSSLDPVLLHNYKGRKVSGSPLFAAIEYCAAEQSEAKKTLLDGDTKAIVSAILAAKANPDSWATHSAGRMQAVHYASGLGSIAALEALKESYGIQHQKRWIETVKRKTETEKGVQHYSPLHDAVWFGREDVVQWLLDEGADPKAENKDGASPISLVADRGLHNLVLPLVQKRASLGKDKNGMGATPLSRAVDSTQYPVEKFHLLAKSCHMKNPFLVDYLEDVYEIAVENEQGANIFVDILLGKSDEERPQNDKEDEAGHFYDGDTKFMRCHWSGGDAEHSPIFAGDCSPSHSRQPLLRKSSSDHCRINALLPSHEEHAPPLVRSRSADLAERRDSYSKIRRSSSTLLNEFPMRSQKGRKNHTYRLPTEEMIEMDKKALEHMADILKCAPKAAGHILEMLLDDPHTENPQHHPLPLRANLGDKNGEAQMNCKYSSDLAEDQSQGPSWKFDTSRKIFKDKDVAPAWHKQIAPMPKDRNDDQEIEMKTVQAIVHCQWNELVKFNVYMHMCLFEASVLLALILPTIIAWAVGESTVESACRVCFQRLCWSVLMATALREICVWCCALRRRYKIIGMDFTLYDIVYVLVEAGFTLILLIFVVAILFKTGSSCDFPKVGTSRRGLLALNFFLRWFRIMYTLRSERNIGPQIVCIVKSFLPMTEMLIVSSVLFFGFGFSAILIGNFETSLDICAAGTEDEDSCGQKIKTPQHLILHLFKALLLGDGEAFDNLRNLQGADQDQKLSTMLVVTASTIFTICVLNLFMAVYSSVYGQKHDQSSKLFFQERACISFESLLQPPWTNSWESVCQGVCTSCENAWQVMRSKTLYCLQERLPAQVTITIKAFVFFIVVFLSSVALMASTMFADLFSLMLAMAIIAAMQLLLVIFSLRCDWSHAESNTRFFLWICSSREGVEERSDKEELKSIREEITELKQLILKDEKEEDEEESEEDEEDEDEDERRREKEELKTLREEMNDLRQLILNYGKVEENGKKDKLKTLNEEMKALKQLTLKDGRQEEEEGIIYDMLCKTSWETSAANGLLRLAAAGIRTMLSQHGTRALVDEDPVIHEKPFPSQIALSTQRPNAMVTIDGEQLDTHGQPPEPQDTDSGLGGPDSDMSCLVTSTVGCVGRNNLGALPTSMSSGVAATIARSPSKDKPLRRRPLIKNKSVLG